MAGAAKPAVGHIGCLDAAIARAAGGILEVPWVPPWTMSYQRAWGRTPSKVCALHIYFQHFISLLSMFKIPAIMNQKNLNMIKRPKIFIPLHICVVKMYSSTLIKMMNSCSVLCLSCA